MLLTEECVHAQVPRTAAERQKYIAAQERRWLALGWDQTRYTVELAQAATQFLSAIAFSDHRDPIDLNLLSDDAVSSADAGTSAASAASRGFRSEKRRAVDEPAHRKPHKKTKRISTVIASGTKVACKVPSLDRSSEVVQWVLGIVSKYSSESRKYEVIDDAEDDAQIYLVPKRDIRILPKKTQNFDTRKRVLAVYPQTTVFYSASLKSRKGKNWLVEFDDEDDQEEHILKEVDGRLIIQE